VLVEWEAALRDAFVLLLAGACVVAFAALARRGRVALDDAHAEP